MSVGSEGSTCAFKHAREISTNDSCIRSAESGAHVFFSSANFVTAKLSTVLSASSGGVGAKTDSVPVCRIYRATNLQRTSGWELSRLFVHTHLTLIGGRPVSVGTAQREPSPILFWSGSTRVPSSSPLPRGCPATVGPLSHRPHPHGTWQGCRILGVSPEGKCRSTSSSELTPLAWSHQERKANSRSTPSQ